MPNATRSQPPKLLDEVRKVLRLHHYSIEFISIDDILGLQRKEAPAMGT